jgi:hypothetical protein
MINPPFEFSVRLQGRQSLVMLLILSIVSIAAKTRQIRRDKYPVRKKRKAGRMPGLASYPDP